MSGRGGISHDRLGGAYHSMETDVPFDNLDIDHLAHHDRAWGPTALAGNPTLTLDTDETNNNMALPAHLCFGILILPS